MRRVEFPGIGHWSITQPRKPPKDWAEGQGGSSDTGERAIKILATLPMERQRWVAYHEVAHAAFFRWLEELPEDIRAVLWSSENTYEERFMVILEDYHRRLKSACPDLWP